MILNHHTQVVDVNCCTQLHQNNTQHKSYGWYCTYVFCLRLKLSVDGFRRNLILYSTETQRVATECTHYMQWNTQQKSMTAKLDVSWVMVIRIVFIWFHLISFLEEYNIVFKHQKITQLHMTANMWHKLIKKTKITNMFCQ